MKIIEPKAELINYNESGERNIAISAKLTHSKKGIDDLESELSDDEVKRLVRKMIDIGHDSTAEHTHYMFRVVCSRVCSHQLVRHRVGTAFSQRSERYVEDDNFKVIVPPEFKENPILLSNYKLMMNQGIDNYKTMRGHGAKKEDARFVLPRVATELSVSFNARALRHFLKLRLDKTAQWEIRDIANQILDIVKPLHANIFHDIEACRKEV